MLEFFFELLQPFLGYINGAVSHLAPAPRTN
jgi:hypothetical protein